MAIDEWLVRTARVPVLRVYRWERPAVSFGYFMKFAEVVRQWPDREPVRRWTGGGVVLHGEDLTYTLVVPRDFQLAALPAGESYRAIHAAIAETLNLQLAPATGEKISEACFENAARHDVLLAGQKVAGAAQRRTRFGLLHQGSIHLGRGVDLPRVFGAEVVPQTLSEEDLAAAREISRDRYESEEWMTRF